MTVSRSGGDSDYGDAAVVTVTFKGPDRLASADKLEKAAKRIDPHAGIFSEQVEVDTEGRRF